MNEKIVVPSTDGTKEQISLPNYGEIIITVRNGKVTNIRTVNDKKIC